MFLSIRLIRSFSIAALLESKDYRCRTPLHLAVDMGRALVAEFLVSMPTPAEVRVAEKDGNMAMSGMIKTMPHVVSSTITDSLSLLVYTRNKLVENVA